MGRSLLCAPYFSSVVLAANALLHSGDDAAKKELLPGIASGETIATLAFTEESGKWDESGITIAATKAGDGYKLNGTKMFVLDGHTANLIIVAARTDAGVSLFRVDADAAGLTRTALATMDQTRKQAKLDFADTPATLIGTDGAGWSVLERVLDLAAVALAAEQVGGAQKVLEMAVEYAKVRVAVRPADRLVPGDQAQVRRHAARGRVGEVRRVQRRLVRLGAQRRAAIGGITGQGLLLGGVLPRRRREHPDPRWYRVHVGAPRAPVLQAGQVVRAAVRRPHLPPRAARAAHRHLSILLAAVAAVLVVVIALVAVGREAFTLGAQPKQAHFDLEEAVAFVADRLPDEVTAVLTYDDVRSILRWHLEYLRDRACPPAGTRPWAARSWSRTTRGSRGCWAAPTRPASR